MMELLDEQPRGKQDYDMWISDGVALGKGKEDSYEKSFYYVNYGSSIITSIVSQIISVMKT